MTEFEKKQKCVTQFLNSIQKPVGSMKIALATIELCHRINDLAKNQNNLIESLRSVGALISQYRPTGMC
jgi:translation initiation factor 2B subunit (eIF-2B alpha/beta/delta family)